MYLFNANLINKVHYNEDGLINAKLISNRAENYIYNGIKIVQTPYVNIEYDDHNQITKVEDAYGIVRSFAYTKNKDLQSEKLTYLNHTKKINYEYKNHQVTKVKNSAETCYHENTYSFDTYPKSRFDSKSITGIYCISLILVSFFMIINLIIGESVELCISITLGGLSLLFLNFFSSRISIVITNNEIIKKSFLGKTIIKIEEIRSIEESYFIKIKSKKELITLETKFYDSGMIAIEKRLSEISINKDK